MYGCLKNKNSGNANDKPTVNKVNRHIHFSLMLYFLDSLNIKIIKTKHEIKKSTAKKVDIEFVNNKSINNPKSNPFSFKNFTKK